MKLQNHTSNYYMMFSPLGFENKFRPELMGRTALVRKLIVCYNHSARPITFTIFI